MLKGLILGKKNGSRYFQKAESFHTNNVSHPYLAYSCYHYKSNISELKNQHLKKYFFVKNFYKISLNYGRIKLLLLPALGSTIFSPPCLSAIQPLRELLFSSNPGWAWAGS